MAPPKQPSTVVVRIRSTDRDRLSAIAEAKGVSLVDALTLILDKVRSPGQEAVATNPPLATSRSSAPAALPMARNVDPRLKG